MNTPNGYNEIRNAFGNPANADGSLNHAWEDANIIKVAPPKGWKLYYQDSQNPLVPITGIRMHRLLKDSFLIVMQQIWDFAAKQLSPGASTTQIQNWLHDKRLDQTGGAFNFRASTGDKSKLSLHSFGIAIDWDPIHNPHKKPITKTLPDWWYQIWVNNGWSDGRHFATPDPMHVQFATGA